MGNIWRSYTLRSSRNRAYVLQDSKSCGEKTSVGNINQSAIAIQAEEQVPWTAILPLVDQATGEELQDSSKQFLPESSRSKTSPYMLLTGTATDMLNPKMIGKMTDLQVFLHCFLKEAFNVLLELLPMERSVISGDPRKWRKKRRTLYIKGSQRRKQGSTSNNVFSSGQLLNTFIFHENIML